MKDDKKMPKKPDKSDLGLLSREDLAVKKAEVATERRIQLGGNNVNIPHKPQFVSSGLPPAEFPIMLKYEGSKQWSITFKGAHFGTTDYDTACAKMKTLIEVYESM